ncbi:RidA family protein [soil metagenome]
MSASTDQQAQSKARPPNKQIVKVDMPEVGQPFSWATRAGSVMFTSAGPVKPDGTIDIGPVEQQTRLTLQNLQKAVEAVGAEMQDVAQVLIYMVNVTDMKVIDSVYREFFSAPYPNRSSMGVSGLVVPGMLIEMVAYVALAP